MKDSKTLGFIAQILLLALGFVLPFEVPLFSLGPLVITLPEFFLYLLFACWVAALSYRVLSVPGALTRARTSLGQLAGAPLPRAVVLWMAVTILSAVAAPSHRLPALKFAFRTLSGVLLYVVACDLSRSSSTARRLVVAIVAGAILSASSTLLETLRPDWASWWQLFRDRQFSASGVLRASGTFAFPNIAAMYWEATLPLLLLVPAGRIADTVSSARLRLALRYLLVAVLIHAILATATRASIYGAAFVAALLLVLARVARSPRIRMPDAALSQFAIAVLVTEILLAAIVLWHSGASSVIAQRVFWWRERDWYRAHYIVDSKEPSRMIAATTEDVRIQVQNVGVATWHSERPPRVDLVYKWESEATGVTSAHRFKAHPTPLNRDILPQEVATITVHLDVPTRPGTYVLRWDLVVEDGEWFSNLGTPPAVQRVLVEPSVKPSDESHQEPLSDVEDASLPSRSQLWIAAVRLWRRHPLLGVGPDNFRRRYGEAIRPEGGGHYIDERLHANNLYLEVLADLGLAGAVAFLILVYALAIQARRSISPAGPSDALVVFALLAILTFFVHGLVDYFFEFTPTLDLWWLLLALASRPPQRPSP